MGGAGGGLPTLRAGRRLARARLHAQVLACNAVLVFLASITARGHIRPALAAGVLAVAVLLAILRRRARAAPGRP